MPEGMEWVPHFMVNGGTKSVYQVTWHVSLLAPGSCPHPPHSHPDEEILIVLAGTAEIQLPDMRIDPQVLRLDPGDLVYYPAGFQHTIRNPSVDPIQYTMIRWRRFRLARSRPAHGGFLLVKRSDYERTSSGTRGFTTTPLFRFPTRHLRELECHVSTVAGGAGYSTHQDNHDVAILLLDGTVTVGDRLLEAPAVCFVPTGVPHDVCNSADDPARYLVFELRGRGYDLSRRIQPLIVAHQSIGKKASKWLAKQKRRAARLSKRLDQKFLRCNR
jgi:quercetin dioxygenase-like cupin family protein